jgi:catechol 2,3-dioxygenase-like lactoylglutathione lyase family enzyme
MNRIHLSLPVADLDASVAFYTALFGQGPDKTRPNFARFTPTDAPLALSLQGGQKPTIDPLPHAHFGLRLENQSDLLIAGARLEETGHLAASEEGTTCCFALQDKHWAVDPDGRAWEMYVLLDDAPNGDSATVATASCCG